jgi:hypothetical protein
VNASVFSVATIDLPHRADQVFAQRPAGAVKHAIETAGYDLAGLMCRSCASADPAVAYLGWSGAIHTFHFASCEHARLFREANRRKIIG